MIVSNESADVFAIVKYSRCSGERSVSSVSSVMPMMPFIGVRISCDMFARNSLFAVLAASAAWWARRRSSSASLRMVMSCNVPSK